MFNSFIHTIHTLSILYTLFYEFFELFLIILVILSRNIIFMLIDKCFCAWCYRSPFREFMPLVINKYKNRNGPIAICEVLIHECRILITWEKANFHICLFS